MAKAKTRRKVILRFERANATSGTALSLTLWIVEAKAIFLYSIEK